TYDSSSTSNSTPRQSAGRSPPTHTPPGRFTAGSSSPPQSKRSETPRPHRNRPSPVTPLQGIAPQHDHREASSRTFAAAGAAPPPAAGEFDTARSRGRDGLCDGGDGHAGRPSDRGTSYWRQFPFGGFDQSGGY